MIIACGALATELRAVLAASSLLGRVDVRFLPANLHNRPDRIVGAIEALLVAEGALDATSGRLDRPVIVGYADCGTGGELDSFVVGHPGVVRLDGAHCYEMFAGSTLFAELHDAEPGTFYLTDFLAKHFDALVWSGLGLDRHPELRDVYFANYRRLVLLSQSTAPSVLECGRAAAERLGLEFVHRHVGLEPFRSNLGAAVEVALRSAA